MFSRIHDTTLKDKKTLAQKALKTSEECGELSEAVLKFDKAHGLEYKISENEDLSANVLQEAADVIICAASTAFCIGFTVDDLKSAIQSKVDKWESKINDC